VTWQHVNRGLATHLMYAVASGDPATQDPFVLFAGLQDNGTRFRADPHDPSVFNQPVGGDGIGATVHASSSGTTYWASVEFGRYFCKPAETDCSVERPEAPDDASSHWHFALSPAGMAVDPDEVDARLRAAGEDTEPFFIHYANVETDTVGQSVLTNSDHEVFVATPSGTGFTWTPISQDLSNDPTGVEGVVRVDGKGLADHTVAIYVSTDQQFHKQAIFLGPATTGADGVFRADVSLPADLKLEIYYIYLTSDADRLLQRCGQRVDASLASD